MKIQDAGEHLRILDAWRGISILLVLAAHLLPLGGESNYSAGLAGMVVFFCLSGFLITSVLLKSDANTFNFLVRRATRIIPLAWLYLIIVLPFQDETFRSWVAHFFFFANLPPKNVRLGTDHFWSLCVELQFYIAIAAVFLIAGVRGLAALPVAAVTFTLLRVGYQKPASIETWFRIDEILAGCWMALVYYGRLGAHGRWVRDHLGKASQPLLALLLIFSCWCVSLPHLEWLTYFRAYFAAAVVGSTLLNTDSKFTRVLNQKVLYWIASISYSLYVIHVGLIYTWLGSGTQLDKYLKRPLLFLVLFVLAYLSTHFYERPILVLSKRALRHWRPLRPASETD